MNYSFMYSSLGYSTAVDTTLIIFICSCEVEYIIKVLKTTENCNVGSSVPLIQYIAEAAGSKVQKLIGHLFSLV